ncbi:MAG: PAS domain-containing protein, partial [Leptospirales bacterium]
MFTTREILSLLRTTLLSLFLLFSAYFLLSGFHLRAEHAQQEVLRRWARADFDLLSLSRTLRILPLSAFLSNRPMTPVEIRLTKGWMIQGQVAIGDLQKARPLFSPAQREELDQVEKNFHLMKAFLRKSAEQEPSLTLKGERVSTSAFSSVWLLERNLGMSLAVLSLSIRGSHGEAEKVLAQLEMIWEQVYGGILFGFLVILLGLEGWELRKSRGIAHSKEAQLQAVFNAMRDSVIYSDLNRLILLANPAAEKIFGYYPSELIGQSVSILYAQLEDFHQTGKLRYHVLAEDDPEPYEVDYLRKNGSRFTGEARGALVRDVTGRVLGFMVTVRDITKRKEMTDRLFLEKEKWYTTLESIGDAVIVSDS